MNNARLLILCLFLLSNPLLGQENKRTNIWYFGYNAGLSFNTQPPTPLRDGVINHWEGCATICDKDGQLLIYTDGMKIWNRNHQVLPGATNLGGHNSASQSGIIVPLPGSDHLLYVFSVDEEGSDSLQYAVVDMRLNGNLGGLVQENGKLKKNILLFKWATEKVTVVPHCNNEDYWIMAHGVGNNTFKLWLLTKNGLSASPDVSIGEIHWGGVHSIGYMKASMDGSKVAVASYGGNFIELFDFDRSSGRLSNPILLKDPRFKNAYGIEFSPSGQYVYLSTTQIYYNSIYQVNLQAGNSAAALMNSLTEIGKTSSSYFGALQLAPDGKIYASIDNRSYLATIHSPDKPGNACGFVEKGIELNGRTSGLGLPNLIPSNLRTPQALRIQVEDQSCKGSLLTALSQPQSPASYQWYRNNVPLPGATGQTYRATTAGSYYFRATYGQACATFAQSSSALQVNTQAVLPDTTRLLASTCNLSLAGTTVKEVKVSKAGCDSAVVYTSYVLRVTTTRQSRLICQGEVLSVGDSVYSKSGTYRNVFTNQQGCDSILITDLAVRTLTLDLGADTSIGMGESIKLTPQVGSGSSLQWKWLPKEGLSCQDCPTPTAAPVSTTTYIAEVTDGITGCTAKDTLNLTVQTRQPTYLFVPDAFTPNGDGVNDAFFAKGTDFVRGIKKMEIYTRWGELLFTVRNTAVGRDSGGWDGTYGGKPVMPGTYVYLVEIELLNGRSQTIRGYFQVIN